MAAVSSAYVSPTKNTITPPSANPMAAPITPPLVIQSPEDTTQPQPIMAPKAITSMSQAENTLSNSDFFPAIISSFLIHPSTPASIFLNAKKMASEITLSVFI